MTSEQIPQISPEKARLQELEATGNFVFHGSRFKLDSLEPKQAYNHPKGEEKIPDGEPAVFASPSADLAIFMAIFSRAGRSGFTMHSDAPTEFRVTPDTLAQANGRKAFVYIFNKDQFQLNDRGSQEVVSYSPVTPIEIIEVGENDLPANIEIKEF